MAANATNYLYVDIASNGTFTQGSTTLAPVRQFGGSRSVTNGQFTYNTQDEFGTVGNGSQAVQTYRVFVGEAVTNGTGVTSTVSYAYRGNYDSGYTNTLPAVGTPITKAHNIGSIPETVNLYFKCLTAELGYSVGQVVRGAVQATGISHIPSLPVSANSVTWMTGSLNSGSIINNTNGSWGTPTLANWAYKITAQR